MLDMKQCQFHRGSSVAKYVGTFSFLYIRKIHVKQNNNNHNNILSRLMSFLFAARVVRENELIVVG